MSEYDEFLMWVLKTLTESIALELSSREFHNAIDERMKNLCEISVLVKGIVILFLFLRSLLLTFPVKTGLSFAIGRH